MATELAAGKLKLQAPVATTLSSKDAAPHSGSSACSSSSSGGGSDGLGGARPLLIVKAARHRPGATPQVLNRFIYFGLETASHYSWCAANPDGKIVGIFDLAGELGSGVLAVRTTTAAAAAAAAAAVAAADGCCCCC